MKQLKLLNKKPLLVLLLSLLFGFSAQSEEPIDIWNVDKKKPTKKNNTIENLEERDVVQNSINFSYCYRRNRHIR